MARRLHSLLLGASLVAPGLAQTPARTPAPPAPAAAARPLDPDRFKPTTLPVIHDPSTVVHADGMYYVFGTGRGITVYSSPDSVTWTRQPSVFTAIPERVHAAVPLNNGVDVWAPDIVRVGGLFYLYYSISKWDSFVSAVALATNPTLNPADPAFHWTDRGVVVASDGVENLNAIDPGVLLAPDGTMWLCYGSYHGTIDLIQLDPKTGLRIAPDSPVTVIASGSEASDLIFRDGFYYLFVNHGSCCKGKDSTYTIRVGRSPTVTGPYVDRYGEPLTRAPGNLFLATHDHRVGPGHFGRLVEDGMERFSLHYEADLTNGGRSTLDLRPLRWSADGWPVAGDRPVEGVYQLLSRRTEDVLTAAPGGALRLAAGGMLDSQRWQFSAAGGGLFRIVNVATGEPLSAPETAAATAARPVAPNATERQLWQLDQSPDGAWRILNPATRLVLAAAGLSPDAAGAAGSNRLTPANPRSVVIKSFADDDLHKWILSTP